MKENGSCQALPLLPTTARTTDTPATRNISFYLSPPDPPAGVGRTDRPPCDHKRCCQHSPRKRHRSGHLCTNPSGSAGLKFHFFPTLHPCSGPKPVLLDETIGNRDKTVLATLFFGPLFHSSNFYCVHYL